MSEYEHLEASTYLVEAYVIASQEGLRFEASSDQQFLCNAAEVLCGAFKKLSGDDQFWAAVIDAMGRADANRGAIREVLANMSDFRALEEKILTGIGLPPDDAARLASDLVGALRLVDEFPSGTSIQNLRSRVDDVGDRVCVCAASAPRQDLDKAERKRRLKQGFKVIGGAVTIVGNGVAAVAFVPTLASIAAGVAVIADAATD